MTFVRVVPAVMVVLLGCPGLPGPDAGVGGGAGGGSAGGSAGGGSVEADLLSGTWRLRVELDPRPLPDGGGRTIVASMAVATVESFTLRRVDAGVYVATAPSSDGGSCCSDITFLWNVPPFSGPWIPPQRFTVAKGTPMRVQSSGMPQMAFQALEDWQVDLFGAGSDGDRDSGIGRIRFVTMPGETRESFGGVLATEPTRYFMNVELTR